MTDSLFMVNQELLLTAKSYQVNVDLLMEVETAHVFVLEVYDL